MAYLMTNVDTLSNSVVVSKQNFCHSYNNVTLTKHVLFRF